MSIDWRPIASAPKDGTPVLVSFGSKGVYRVTWEDPHGDGDYSIWCVDDDKHGPYPLRGYSDAPHETAPTHWQPLPAPPGSPTVAPTPTSAGAAVELDEPLLWLLKLIDAAGGATDASDYKGHPLNVFCDDRGRNTDTFNIASDRGLICVTHNDLHESSLAEITEDGRVALQAALARRGTSPTAAAHDVTEAEVEAGRAGIAKRTQCPHHCDVDYSGCGCRQDARAALQAANAARPARGDERGAAEAAVAAEREACAKALEEIARGSVRGSYRHSYDGRGALRVGAAAIRARTPSPARDGNEGGGL